MVKIVKETIIEAKPEAVWEFLTNLEKNDNYRKWHPKDHIKLICLKGNLQDVGSIIYFEEHLGKFLLKLKYKITRSTIAPYYLEYVATFPLSLLHAGKAYFKIEPMGNTGSRLLAGAEYGYNIPFIGELLDDVIETKIKRKDIEKHMEEEGENIRQLLTQNK